MADLDGLCRGARTRLSALIASRAATGYRDLPLQWKRRCGRTAGTEKWFRRAYDDLAVLVRPGKWRKAVFSSNHRACVMAGMGVADGRAVQALDSVASIWRRRTVSFLQQPPFSQYYVHLGEISSIRRDTKRTPVFSVIPIRGSWWRNIGLGVAIKRSIITNASARQRVSDQRCASL